MVDRSTERLLAGLTDPQRLAVTSEAGSLAVVAGAGSGKTTVLTRRVAWRVHSGSADPVHVLVVTFTRKAAVELRQRLWALGVGAGVTAATFHAAAFAQLRRHWADRGQPPPAVLADPARLLSRLLDETGVGDPGLVPAVRAELSWARARGLGPEQYAEHAGRTRRSTALPVEQLAQVLERYDAEKRRRRVVDLDDLVLRCTELLEADPAAAAAVRWQVQHVFVDEFQDVNPAQWRLVEAWRHGRDDLCVVGDPRQAIYAWNGSDPALLARLPALVPGIVTVRLDDNHRSSPQIVAAAGALLSADGADARTLPQAVRDDGEPPVLWGFDDEEAEADALARWLRSTRRPGHPWAHQAVLARTHARLEPVAAALDRAGIPYVHAGSRGQPAALRAVLAELRSARSSGPVRSALVEALGQLAEAHRDDATRPPERVTLDRVAAQLGRLVDEHAVDEPRPTVGSFLAWLAANRGATDLDPGPLRGAGSQAAGTSDTAAGPDEGGTEACDAVTLATFHQAKGLEWPTVAVVGLEEGTVPIVHATSSETLAEERRLLYVAVTRAESRLWCSWAAVSSSTRGARRRRPSPLLGPLRAVLAEQAPLQPDAALARLGALRERLAAAG
jgi:DNA helicase-2/ATP-dependent DNA helicase PcrA